MKRVVLLTAVVALCCQVFAQSAVKVGAGSYAAYAPYAESKSSAHQGCNAYYMEHRPVYITNNVAGKPIPSNDWWTDLLVSQYSGELWAYPQKVSATPTGVRIEYPTYWGNTGNEMYSKSYLNVGASSFYPVSAAADDWHDWGFRFAMQDNDKQMLVTLAHGMPYTWIECTGITPYLSFEKATFIVNGKEKQAPFTANEFVLQIAGDNYGIYTPEGTRFVMSDKRLEVRFTGNKSFLVIAALPSEDDLAFYKQYAYSVPRNTEVSWQYIANNGKLKTTWSVTADNLNGGTTTDVLQGFIPHHYKNTTRNFNFLTQTYLTPRGTMKMAAGKEFVIEYDYNGVLPFYPQPVYNAALANPYQRDRMVSMISDYAKKGTFGSDTYWGGKGLTQMAHYMCFAHEMGETELFELCKSRLKAVLIDWLTYTPGETQFYFAKYPRWGAYVGFNPSYDSDTFNDHHFHYGYYTYSAALLAMFDEDFKNNYGEMIKLVARDYANWDRSRTDVPFLRTMDPWCGHSFAGGMGGWQGNGQESSSEAMQGWGGVLLLGAALGDDAMRDAGIFGYVSEARATAEYWFDRDRENIDYTKYTSPWSTNLTTQGVGWWTWFSGDYVWMHSIQWLPISPILKYLYEDKEFAKWDFETMMKGKTMGDWTEPGGLGSESGIGNVCLSYMQIFDPNGAAQIFDQMWDGNYALAKNTDTGGITYYITHMHRSYGEIQWNIHADMPLSTCYYNEAQGKYYYVVFNASKQEQTVVFYEGNTQKVSFKAPAGKLTVYSDAPVLTTIQLSAPAATVARGAQMQISAVAYDQYGATINKNLTWSTSAGNISTKGVLKAPNTNGTVVVTAKNGTISGSISLRVNDAPVLSSATLLPSISTVEVGTSLTYNIELKDQYGDAFAAARTWEISYNNQVVANDSVLNATQIGTYKVKVQAAGQTYQTEVLVLPVYPNIALNKTCTASSSENAGTAASRATDGNYTTRWGSAHKDGEWIYVDLTENCYVGAVGIKWENAYASLYKIQISDNATDWTTIQEVTGSNSYILTEVNANARYVRMLSVERATNYGTSLYELEVFGVRSSLTDNDVFGLDITPKTERMLQSETLQLQATAYNKKGKALASNVTWAISSGNATISNTGLLTPTGFGTVVVSATAAGTTSTQTILVEESVQVESLGIQPSVAYLSKGDQQTFNVVAYDQFSQVYEQPITCQWQLIGNGSTFKNGVFTANANGTYQLIASYGNIKDTAVIQVTAFNDKNLALHKKTSCSSYEGGGTLSSNVNDGDYVSRWGSLFHDGEYVVIDLEDYYNVNQIKIFWQQAYATEYHIETSMDEERWQTVYSTKACAGGDEVINITETAARYIRVTCDKRYNANWGVSIREIEVYGSSKAEAPYPVSLYIVPPYTFYVGNPAQLAIKVYNQYGSEIKQNPTPEFSVTGGGTISEYGVFTPTLSGKYTLVARWNNQIENYIPIEVKEPQMLTTLTVVADAALLEKDASTQVNAYAYDQYGNLMEADVTLTTTLGTITNKGVFSSNTVGTAVVTASVEKLTATCQIQVIEEQVDNLALKKPATASSGNAGNAVDGNTGTRWESNHSDNQWIYVDLQAVYQLTSMQILWETASAKDYRVEVSNDATNWVSILEMNDMPAGTNRVDEATLGGVGRYVRVYCAHRTTNYGSSIYELRLFGVLASAGKPYAISFTQSTTDMNTTESYQFKVQVTDINGTVLQNQPITWTATGGTITNNGVYTAVEDGLQTITASVGNIKVSCPVNVNLKVSAENVQEEAIRWYKQGELLYVSGNNLRQAAIYDLAGRLLQQAVPYAEGMQFGVAAYHGIYLLLVRNTNGEPQLFKVYL